LRINGTESRNVCYTRIAARSAGGSAAWLLQRTGKRNVGNRLAGAIALAPGGLSELPHNFSGVLGMLRREVNSGHDHETIAAAIVALRRADALIVGPLGTDDADAPGLLPHLAELASSAYRALRPPADLIGHMGFRQVARRFQYIQMSHRDARWLAAGAVDLGVLAQSLRQVLADAAEFAITSFTRNGLLWADNRWWEIDAIGGNEVDEERAAAAFCAAWVVARRFRRAGAAQAIAYARATAAAAGSHVERN
jgi:hypothetical protein